jgi:hypothetical protein
MMIADHPRWQDGPKPFRILIARLLVVHAMLAWGGDAENGADGAKLEQGLDPRQVGENGGAHSHHPLSVSR